MPFRFNDRTIDTVAGFLEFITEDERALLEGFPEDTHARFPGVWYRGLPDVDWELLPTLHRDNIAVTDEPYLMNRFRQNAHEFLDERPQGEWEWMLLARHHGLPSRLLDWTESPLTGLYFAAGGEHLNEPNANLNNADGALWCLLPGVLNEHASGGTVRTDVIPMFREEADLDPVDQFLTNYQASRVKQAMPGPSLPPAAAISVRTTKRIQAQLGVFTIHHADTTPLERVADGTHLWRYVIPPHAKPVLLEELRRLRVTALTVFPELDTAAMEARRGY